MAWQARLGEDDRMTKNFPEGENERYEIPRSFAAGASAVLLWPVVPVADVEASWELASRRVSKPTMLPLLEASASQLVGSRCTGCLQVVSRRPIAKPDDPPFCLCLCAKRPKPKCYRVGQARSSQSKRCRSGSAQHRRSRRQLENARLDAIQRCAHQVQKCLPGS